ncbi:sulfatase, partial [Pseudomonas sp. MAFF212428]|nr:sulfatase [Pseudomonas brassicae]
MRGYIKGLLLVVYLLSFSGYYIERLEAIGLGVALVLYAGVFGVLLVALWLSANIRQGLVRWVFALGFFASA